MKITDPGKAMKYDVKEPIFALSMQEWFESIVILTIHSWEKYIKSNRPIDKTINLSHRELYGAFCVAATFNHFFNENSTVASDPEGGDGTIFYTHNGKGTGFHLEQVIATEYSGNGLDLTSGVKKAIDDKASKGREYMRNRDLVVMCDIEGNLNYGEINDYFQTSEHIQFNHLWLLGYPKNMTDFNQQIILIHKHEYEHGLVPPQIFEIRFDKELTKWEIEQTE